MVPKKPGMIAHEYAREAYKNGLMLEAKLGANPFKFGLAGGTDAHTGLTAAEENNFFGKFPTSEPSPERWNENAFEFEGRVVKGWELGASGWTGVWATENTRAAAVGRHEAQGDLRQHRPAHHRALLRRVGFHRRGRVSRQPAEAGYAKGVPMGGDLQAAPQGKAPTFLVAALKDPLSGNLDRIQIIKGWLDTDGKTQEKIYDVVWAMRTAANPARTGKLPPVGNTVNAAKATWTNTIGDPELIAVWKDPDSTRAQSASTTPASSRFLRRAGPPSTPSIRYYDGQEVPISIQERAYTSPIWYTPGS